MNNKPPRLSRVIFCLEDGRKKYATHRGLMLQWSRSEIVLLIANVAQHGYGYFTADLQHYAFDRQTLLSRCHRRHLVEVVDIEYESITTPLDATIIL